MYCRITYRLYLNHKFNNYNSLNIKYNISIFNNELSLYNYLKLYYLNYQYNYDYNCYLS